jgi:hypothetical protein
MKIILAIAALAFCTSAHAQYITSTPYPGSGGRAGMMYGPNGWQSWSVGPGGNVHITPPDNPRYETPLERSANCGIAARAAGIC